MSCQSELDEVFKAHKELSLTMPMYCACDEKLRWKIGMSVSNVYWNKHFCTTIFVFMFIYLHTSM